MSDTPRTDRQTFKLFAGKKVYQDAEVVYAHFAQDLERENNELRSAAAKLADKVLEIGKGA